MKKYAGWIGTAVLISLSAFLVGQNAYRDRANPNARQQDWTNYTRIAAWLLKADNAEKIVREAEDSHVSGIEVDNDIPGRYESFLNPEGKLAAIRAVAERAQHLRNSP